MTERTIKQRALRVEQRLHKVDHLLQEAHRRGLDPLVLIARGISNHDRRLTRAHTPLPGMRGTFAGGSQS